MLRTISRGLLLLVLAALSSACPDKEEPEVLIRRAIENAAAAAEKKDTAGVMEIVSENVKARGMSHQDIKRMVFGQLRIGDWQKVFVVRTVVAVESETTAKAETTVVLARGKVTSLEDAVKANGGTYQGYFGFAKESDGWKIVEIEYRNASLKNLVGVE